MTSRSSKLLAAFLLVLGFPLTVAPGFAQPNFSGVVAFGDSLTDAGNVGNNNGLSTNSQNQSGRGYGGTWAVQLAAQLGYNLTASNSGGTDFAVGGQNSAQIVDQVNNSYLSGVGGKASPTTLYLMLGGINDWWGDEPSARASANNLNNAIVSLINAGAKYIVWVNMISADTSPGLQGSGYVNFRNNVGYFLDQWATDVANLRSSYPGVTIYAIDEYRQDQLLGANAGAFDINTSVGFTQADASVRGAQASDSPNADLFSSWDGGHPTTWMHFITASNCYAAITGLPVDGSYNIVNLNSGINLDTVNQSTSNGTLVDQATPNSNSATQQWDVISAGMSPNIYLLINHASGRLLEVYGQATNSGAAVDIWDNTYNPNQRWIVTGSNSGSYTVTGQQSGNNLEVWGFWVTNGAAVDVWAPTGGANQGWLFNRLDQSPQPK